jgi:thiosulfate dehydrogenase (quinone) large subunit
MTFPTNRANQIAVVRILFGVVWLIDAQFKWRPAFIEGLATYLAGALPGQPVPVQSWIHFWMQVVKIDPTLFAYFVASAETALAFALIFGVLSNLAYLGGSVLSLMIWSTAEGFGGLYIVGATDIGAAIIYVFVFALLYLSRAGLHVGFDQKLAGMLGSWSFLASGPVAGAR